MPQNNLLLLFFRELFLRFRKKSPKFFQYFQWTFGILTALTGLPAFLTDILHVTLSPALLTFENRFIGALSTGVLFMSLLTSQSTINSISPQGVANKQTDPKLLPFTAAVELKDAEKEGKPTEIDPNQNSGRKPPDPPLIYPHRP